MSSSLDHAEAPTVVINRNELDVWAGIARHTGSPGKHAALDHPAEPFRRPATSYASRHAAPEDGAR